MNFKVFLKGNLIKIAAVALICPLMLLCGCKDKDTKGSVSEDFKNKTSSTSKKDKTSKSDKNGAEYPLIVSTTNPFPGTGSYEIHTPHNETKLGVKISRLLEKYKGQNVLFDLVLIFDYKKSPDNIEEYAINVGLCEIEKSDYGGMADVYFAIGKAQTIENILNYGHAVTVEINYLTEVVRAGGYSKVISDALSLELEKHEDTDEIEVLVSTRAEKQSYGYMALYQQYGMLSYNRDLFSQESLNELKNGNTGVLSYTEYAVLSEKYVSKIIERNDIAKEKIIPSLQPLGLHITEERYNQDVSTGKFSMPEGVLAGFTAKLTKEEIVRLANSEDIKIIHNDISVGAYTVNQ